MNAIDAAYRRFWTALLAISAERTALHRGIKPGSKSWIRSTSVLPGVTFTHVLLRRAARVELYVFDKDRDTNKAIFDALQANRDDIDLAFGSALRWERLDQKKACRISSITCDEGLDHTEHWGRTADSMIGEMIRLERALRPGLRNLGAD